jgi:hypothetical protein
LGCSEVRWLGVGGYVLVWPWLLSDGDGDGGEADGGSAEIGGDFLDLTC